MKSVLSTKVKYVRLGTGPGFGVGCFIVILSCGRAELGAVDRAGREAFTAQPFDLTGSAVVEEENEEFVVIVGGVALMFCFAYFTNELRGNRGHSRVGRMLM